MYNIYKDKIKSFFLIYTFLTILACVFSPPQNWHP